MATIPIPQGATVGDPQSGGMPIPEGAQIGEQDKPIPILEGYQRAGRILKHAGSDLASSVGGMADMFSGSPVTAPLKLGAGMTGRYMDAYKGAKDAAKRGDTTESMFKSVAVPFAPLGADEIYDDAKSGNNEAAVGKGISRIGQLVGGEVAPHVLPETMPKFSLPEGGDFGAKASATGKLLGREVTGRVPILNRFESLRKPTFSEYAGAFKAKADPQLGLFNRTPKLGDTPPVDFNASSPAVQGRTDPFIPKGMEPAPYRLRGKQIQDAATVTPRQLIGPERQLGTGEAPVASPAVKPIARATEQPTVWPPERPSVIQPKEFRGRADSLEDKGFQEANREDLEKHGHSAFSQAKRDWFARNVPGSSKGDLVAQARGEVPVESPNGSGESSASREAISRVASEKANKVERFRIDTRSGKETPLIGVDAVDAKAGPYDRIVKRGPKGEEVQDEGGKARPVIDKKYSSASWQDGVKRMIDEGKIVPGKKYTTTAMKNTLLMHDLPLDVGIGDVERAGLISRDSKGLWELPERPQVPTEANTEELLMRSIKRARSAKAGD